MPAVSDFQDSQGVWWHHEGVRGSGGTPRRGRPQVCPPADTAPAVHLPHHVATVRSGKTLKVVYSKRTGE